MSYWQVSATSASGQTMTFGLEAPSVDEAAQTAQSRLPFAPAAMLLKEIPPRCRAHGVRHYCVSSVNN
jgi:hypothetical protein